MTYLLDLRKNSGKIQGEIELACASIMLDSSRPSFVELGIPGNKVPAPGLSKTSVPLTGI